MSKRVALVMSYPYESFVGGESAYIAALRRFLVTRGHVVDTIVSDVTRGRSNPVVRLGRVERAAGRLHIRRAVAIGENRALSFDPALLGRAAATALHRPVRQHEEHRAGERRWVLRRLRDGRYDAAILLFDAGRHAGDAAAQGLPTLALKGFFSQRLFGLGETVSIAPESLPAAAVAELAAAPLVGLNNRAEIAALAGLRPKDSVLFVGMGFAARAALPRSDMPHVLFVGAETGTNRASLRWFLEEVWPAILTEQPTARLRVAGAVGRAFAGEAHAGVDLLGLVDRLEDEYAAAQVVVTPLTLGSAGVKTKVAEALAYGRPLVTTSLGVDPSEAHQFGAAVDITDDAATFARAVTRLLADPALRAHRADLAREAFQRTFSNDAAYGPLAAALGL